MMQSVLKYFVNLEKKQIQQLTDLLVMYSEWNTKINVISRKDMEHFYIRHVLYSLTVLKFFSFKQGTAFLDVGTGGGFPGIPLAICLPQCEFVLCDSVSKKIRVVEDVASKLQLNNMTCIADRVEKIKQSFDVITGRAVTVLPDFVKLTEKLISKKQKNDFPNGIIYLKGGDFESELYALKKNFQVYELKKNFDEIFFETKKIVHVW
jgi:16S rRNA (guanine527-N7)-methyltransferase